MQVHHLIEECILFNMSKEECMEALSKHANIKPVITATGNFALFMSKIASHPLKHAYSCVYIYTCVFYFQCGKNWRRKIRSSLKLTREPELRDNGLQKRREKKRFEICFQILLLSKIPKPITASSMARDKNSVQKKRTAPYKWKVG